MSLTKSAFEKRNNPDPYVDYFPEELEGLSEVMRESESAGRGEEDLVTPPSHNNQPAPDNSEDDYDWNEEIGEYLTDEEITEHDADEARKRIKGRD